jgi:uncharacterized membrane protein
MISRIAFCLPAVCIGRAERIVHNLRWFIEKRRNRDLQYYDHRLGRLGRGPARIRIIKMMRSISAMVLLMIFKLLGSLARKGRSRSAAETFENALNFLPLVPP